MSIILDALKKSERERQAGQVPGMSAVVNEAVSKRPQWMLRLGVVLALLNIGGVGYWIYREHSVTVPVSPNATANLGDPAVPQKELTILPPAPQTLPPADLTPPLAPIQMMPPQEPLQQRPNVPMPERLMPPANPQAFAHEEEDPVDAELEAEGASKSEALAPRNRIGMGLPMINDMPETFRSRIPSFRITMFAYSENPQERFVIVNMKKLVAGDVLPGGVLLIEIRAENLVGELDGQKFLIPRY